MSEATTDEQEKIDARIYHFVTLNKRARLASFLEIGVALSLLSFPITRIWLDPTYHGAWIDYVFMALVFLEVTYFTLTTRGILVDAAYGYLFKDRFDKALYNENLQLGKIDPLTEFRTYISRSRESLKAAQRRPNALIMIGAVIAISGLVFFVTTLPSLVNNAEDSSKSTIFEISEIVDLIPRLLMLVFIQLLAGFFLRQYRTSMEEVRYYESVLRIRENQILALMVAGEGDSETKKIIIDSLLSSGSKDTMKLQQGESTVTIESYRSDENEFKGPFDRIMDLMSQIKK